MTTECDEKMIKKSGQLMAQNKCGKWLRDDVEDVTMSKLTTIHVNNS